MSNKAATIEPRATSHEFDSCPLISVIIPVYNVEKYLDECVNSVLNQTYRNLEVILVDDGSTDKSPAMCDEWAHRDSRVRVIHKDNGGAALARNAGLETANGAFIATVDSDDFIAPNMYERLYTLLTDNDADLSICEFSLIDEAGNILVMEGNKMPAFWSWDEDDADGDFGLVVGIDTGGFSTRSLSLMKGTGTKIDIGSRAGAGLGVGAAATLAVRKNVDEDRSIPLALYSEVRRA